METLTDRNLLKKKKYFLDILNIFFIKYKNKY
jgi:hypothetical protein